MATPVGTGTKSQRIEPLTKHKAWKALQTHYEKIRKLHRRDLFAADPKRGERMTAEAVGLFLDYSKNRITDETVKLLIELTEESGRRHVSRGEDQHHGEAGSPARGPARA
jgi:glucose-6-phosphate isomerase